MLRRLIYLFALISLLATITSPVQSALPTPTPDPNQTQVPDLIALEAKLGLGVDSEQFPPAAPLTITFSQPMDLSSAQPALLTFPYLPGKETWDNAAQTLTFLPQGGFPVGKEIQIFLADGLRSKRGEDFLVTQNWTLKVLGAPRIISHNPAEPQITIRKPNFTVLFDREMATDSLKTAIRFDPPVSFEINSSGRKVDFVVTQPLDPGVVLKLSISTDAHDTSGASLDRPYSWSYRVAPFELTDLFCNQKRIDFRLSYPVDLENLEQSIAFDPPLKGKWTDRGESKFFIFIPDTELDWAKQYTIGFKKQLIDKNGFLLPTFDPVRCTIPPPFTVSPNQTDPENYSVVKQIDVSFQTEMDGESVQQGFIIKPEVPGKLTFTALTKNTGKLTFIPEKEFAAGAYTVSLSPSIRTADGRPILLDTFSWQITIPPNFQTLDTSVFTYYGPNIQVVDADAPRYLQFSGQEDQQRLYFDAYTVDLPQFIQLYRKSFGTVSYYGNRDLEIDTEGLQLAQSFSTSSHKGVNDLLLPSDLSNGLYVLNMRTAQGLLDQIFLVLSRNTITAKLSGSRLFTWTTNINGEVVPDAEMRLFTESGELMREGKTDDQGIYETSTPIDSKPILIAARDKDGDITISGLTGAWTSHQSSNYWYWWYDDTTSSTTASRLMAYIFTDRPIYRPGNTVNYKAILRQDNDVRYTLLESDQPITVRLLDARGNLLEERQQYANDFGTINGDFVLPSEGNLGNYRIEVKALGESIQQSFSVEEYHKPDYSVSIQAAKKEYVQGETVDLTVEALYFLGQPVANADVTLKFFNYWDPTTIIKGKTGPDGRYVYKGKVTLSGLMPWYNYDVGYNWGSSLVTGTQAVEVTVSDGSNQPVSSAIQYYVHSAAEGITLDTHGYFKSPGQPFIVDIRATTFDGQPVANRKMTVMVNRLNYTTWDRQISKVDTITDADGKASVEINIEAAGDYKIVVTGKGKSGEEFFNSKWVTAFKPYLAWDFGEQDEVSIYAEKEAYRPYERAKIILRSTFSGPALLTFERGSVIHSQMVNLTAPITEIETEIIPEYSPNVYITINAWEDIPYKPYKPDPDYYLSSNRPNSNLRIASVELQVESTDKLLDLAVTSDKSTYSPREQAEFTIQVSKAGVPVQAELSIGLVDEAIYSLKAEPWKAIFPAFYDPRVHAVSTYDSMAILRYIFYDSARGGGGEPSINPESPRSEFPDTAVWLPTVVTDAQGKAVVTLALPDSLTRWRLTVRAVTRDTRVGETTYTIQTKQDLSLRPAFPSVVTEGDRFVLEAYVHNTGESIQFLSAELSAPGLTLLEGRKQEVQINPGQSVPIHWWVLAEDPGTVQVTVFANVIKGMDVDNSTDQGDAIRLPITIQPRAVLSLDQHNGQFSEKLELPIFIPPTATSASSVRLELSRSMAGDAISGLEALIGYPYGCVEQTMSKALPNAVVGQALKRLGLSNPELEKKLPGLIDAGVKKLYGMQHYDGGWGWWTDDSTDAYQTAWVVFGLSLTRDAGYLVDPNVIHRGARALKGMLHLDVPEEENEQNWRGYPSEDELDPRLKAFMAYSLALAGEGNDELTLGLYEIYPVLDAFSQSALALTLHLLGHEREAGEIVSELENSVFRENGEAYWPGLTEDGIYHQKTMSSEIRTAALALEAIQTIHPQSSLSGEIVRYLMAHKQLDGWGTTNETAFTLLALTDQLEAVKNSTGPTKYQVLVNGKEAFSTDWKYEELTTVVELSKEIFIKGLNRLEVIPDNDTTLYYSLGVKWYGDAALAQPAGSMIIQRDYLDSTGKDAITEFEAGQIVMVRLSVTSKDSLPSYMMVEDHLPGGLEALNEGLNTTSREFNAQSLFFYEDYYYGNESGYSPFMWDRLGYNNKEIHNGRVTFFTTSAEGSKITFRYFARALRSGTFTALPAEVSAMYNPNLWGRSQTGVIEVK